jgi:hypothetical protein
LSYPARLEVQTHSRRVIDQRRIIVRTSLFWLAYEDGVYVVLQAAPSLVHARMVAASSGLEAGTFSAGHELDDRTSKKVPIKAIGKCLNPKQAEELLKKLSGSILNYRGGRGRTSPSMRDQLAIVINHNALYTSFLNVTKK